jgi:hypothetical protein
MLGKLPLSVSASPIHPPCKKEGNRIRRDAKGGAKSQTPG